MNRLAGIACVALLAAAPDTLANQWVSGEIVRISTYKDFPDHFVWLSSGVAAECQAADPANPVLRFSESSANGKSLLAALIAATAAQRRVDLNISGCTIVEMYFNGQ